MTRLKNLALQGLAILVVLISLMGFFYTREDSHGEKNEDHIVLTSDNVVVLDSEIDDSTVAEVENKARSLKGCPIYLFLKTPGGSVPAALEMFDTLKGIPCPIKTITRYAASMGFHTVQNLDERLALPNASFMSHHARGQFTGEYGGKRPTQLDKRIALSVSQWQELDKIVVARTNGKQTLTSYQAAYENEIWLTAKQAIEQGYADRIVTAECDKSLDGGTPIVTMFQSSTITFEKSNCPLISGPVKVNVKLPGIPGLVNTAEIKAAFLRQFNERKSPTAYW